MGTHSPWSGRFEKPLDELVQRFNASIGFDQRLAEEDVAGSIAHAKMLAAQGIITRDEAAKIIEGLDSIRNEIRAGTFAFRLDREDIHFNVEGALADRIGAVAGKLHTGRSRNDQVALDVRLFTRQALEQLQGDVLNVIDALIDRAAEHTATILPGYTHLQRAQPVVLAHHLLAYVEMLRRDYARLSDARGRLAESPLGAGALAGTTFPLDREAVARNVGFPAITRNSLDSVADRDFALEFLATTSILSVHLSRFAEELVLWSTQEFGFLIFDDAYATGSSMMPQKKNPDTAELIRGKTGRVIGHLVAALVLLKGLPLAYNKDLQEDKEALFDAYDTAHDCLRVLEGIVRTVTFRTDRMRQATTEGFLNATDLADYLVTRGLPFREAHGIVSQVVLFAERAGKTLEQLTLEELRLISPLFDAGAQTALDVDQGVLRRDLPGGTSPRRVQQALEEARNWWSVEVGRQTAADTQG
ncbi:MAG: argininosuccinate lyase [Chloroflexi bacterium]|nr:argininosuccinate lyase [Chloroflexota bacterium]